MRTDISDVRVGMVGGQPKLRISFGSQRIEVPLTEQVALVLNAGGWLMREYGARAFEEDLGGPNLVSRRLRQLPLGPPEGGRDKA